MENKLARNFRIQIWFDAVPDKMLLGIVSVYAETEEGALSLAKAHTDYRLSGVDNVNWEVREPVAAYA